jgi:glycosyltransferase involved in cell wall biosynthesis
MKILIIHPYSFSDYKGGVELYCQNLMKGLAGYKNLNVSQVNGYFFKLFGEPLPKIKIFQIIKNRKPDIIHLQGPRPFATVTGIFGKVLGRKTALTYHAHLNPRNYFKKVVATVDKLISKYIFDFCIVTSEDYKKKVEKFFPEKRIKVIPLLVEDRFFQYQKTKEECRKNLEIGKEKIVLFVGKLDKHHYYKGVDVCIEAAKLLPERIKIILIGEGDKRDDYEKMVFYSGVAKRIKFVGEVNQEDLMKYYRASDILVLPSISDSEGFGFVLLEAMAMGLPVITTEVVGSANLIKEREAGIIIPANNPQALAKAIQDLLTNNSFYQTLKENGQKFAQEFRLQNNVDKFLEVYKNPTL